LACAAAVLGCLLSAAASSHITRASVTNGGESANADVGLPWISGDGSVVSFSTAASNLDPADTAGWHDTYVRLLGLSVTEEVSITTNGNPENGTSGWGGDTGIGISRDGRYVAFISHATNLVPGGSSGHHVFLRDRTAGTTELVDVSSSEAPGTDLYPRISQNLVCMSDDGRYVAFISPASNLVPSDTNSTEDVFVRDRLLGTTERVSVATGGGQVAGEFRNQTMSGDGRYVAYQLGNHVYLHDRTTVLTTQIAVGRNPSLSRTGQYLVYDDAGNPSQIRVLDRSTNTTTIASLGLGNEPANFGCFFPRISEDGRFVSFHSSAFNLVANDLNSRPDVFIRDRAAGQTICVSVDGVGNPAAGGESAWASLSQDGREVAFRSAATNLVATGNNPFFQVYVTDNPLASPPDTTAPSCTVQPVVVESPARVYVPVTLADSGSGVAKVQLTSQSSNSKLEWDGPGGTVTAGIGGIITITPAASSTTIRAVKLNASQRARVELKVWDAAGNSRLCDPVIANLELKKGRRLTRTFRGIPEHEHYVTIQNGTPGFTEARVWVNGRPVSNGALSAGQTVTLDVAQWMRRGNRNTFRITATGAKGATAVLLIGDASLAGGGHSHGASLTGGRINSEWGR